MLLMDFDQQPIGRTVGTRRPAPPGVPPDARARAAWDAMGRYRTRAPKGVYRYRSHAEMQKDSEAWLTRAIVERQL
jgi:hypothetical protein